MNKLLLTIILLQSIALLAVLAPTIMFAGVVLAGITFVMMLVLRKKKHKD